MNRNKIENQLRDSERGLRQISGYCGVDALAKILDLSNEEKIERGLSTPSGNSPAACHLGVNILCLSKVSSETRGVPSAAGFGRCPAAPKPTVFLVGAGTSDYVGRNSGVPASRLWKCEVIAVPSTSPHYPEEEWLIPVPSIFGSHSPDPATVRKVCLSWKRL